MTDPLASIIAEGLTEAIAFVRASERVRSMIVTLKQQGEELVALYELDPDLEPELTAVLSHMSDTVDALARAQTFLSARMSAKIESL